MYFICGFIGYILLICGYLISPVSGKASFVLAELTYGDLLMGLLLLIGLTIAGYIGLIMGLLLFMTGIAEYSVENNVIKKFLRKRPFDKK